MQSSEVLFLTARGPDATIAFGPDGPVRLDRFLGQVAILAERLPERSYVLNLVSDRYRYLLSFCAAIVAGQCTLMPPNRSAGVLEQLRAEYPDCYAINDDDERLSGLDEAGCTEAAAPRIAADQLCAIAFTSGSTGKPKGNRKYWCTLHDGSVSNAKLLLGGMRLPLNVVATVPPQHMWGLEMSVLLPLFSETAVSHGTPFFPQDIADGLAAVPAPRALVSSPFHLDALLRSGVDVAALERIFTATAPLSTSLAQNLEERFDTTVVDVYGCSEVGVLAARRASGDQEWLLAEIFELLPGQDGTTVRASHLPEEVVMPDIIEVMDNGRFKLVGRHQDMLNIAGKRGSLAELNQRLKHVPGVIDGVIFMPDDSDRLAAMVVAPDLSAGDILEYLRAYFDPVFLPRPLYLVSRLPRQETGKLSRSMVLELFDDLHDANGPRKSSAPEIPT